MEARLFKYIWHYSRREQMVILAVVLISLPFYYVLLELPKAIVNRGIQGVGFDGEGTTQTFMRIGQPWGGPESAPLFAGFELQQIGLLLALSFAFLGLVFVNGGFKFWINTAKGRMGERMLRRLRYELTDRVLRFPLPQLRKMKQAEVATMIKDEVEPLGGFIGDAFVTPVQLSGTALTAMFFIMVQSVWLGMVALSIVVIQAFVIPRLRRKILILGKERQITARHLAGRIAELIDGATEVHAHDTSNYERADIVSRLGRIFAIRYEIYQRKFFVKFLNNFLSQMTPFLFYSVGGVLAITGRLDIGALVAVIAAYKDLPGPIKELIDWDQQRADVQIKYEQVIDQFQPGEILDPEVQDVANVADEPLSGEIKVATLRLIDESDSRLLDGIDFSAPVDEHIAIVGDSASGKEHLGQLLAGLLRPSSGDISVNGHTLTRLPQAVTGRRISYVGPDAYLFPISVRENLLYGLKHRPWANGQAAPDEALNDDFAEAKRAGNPLLDITADWIDYRAAGATGPEDIDQRLIEMLQLVELDQDVYRFGLSGSIDPEENPELAEGILRAREKLVERLAAEDASDLVVRFDPDAYNRNATIGKNLLFGNSTRPEYAADRLAENKILLEVLEQAGMTSVMLEMGLSIARTMVEIFADLPPGHPFFEQFSFIDADDLPEYRLLVPRAEKVGIGALNETDKRLLMALPFAYSEERHRLALIDDEVEAKFLDVRKRVLERLAAEDPEAVEVYKPEAYNSAATLMDNVLFGRIAHGRAQAQETVGSAVTEVLGSLGLCEKVIEVGLDFNVGIGGKRLNATQRQKLAIARAILKQPDLLILNEAAAGMDGASQRQLMRSVIEARQGRGLIWTLQQPSAAEAFDRVLVMDGGRLVGQGAFEELRNSSTTMNRLMQTN